MTADILDRLRTLREALPQFAGELVQLELLLPLDAAASLNKMRTIIEHALFEMCTVNSLSWGNAEPTLERMIGPLLSKGLVPKSVGLHIRTVQTNSSPGSHYQVDALDEQHATVALAAMIAALEWYAQQSAPPPAAGDGASPSLNRWDDLPGRGGLRAIGLGVCLLLFALATTFYGPAKLWLSPVSGKGESSRTDVAPVALPTAGTTSLVDAAHSWQDQTICVSGVEPLNIDARLTRALDLHVRSVMEQTGALRVKEIGSFTYDEPGRREALDAAIAKGCTALLRGALGVLGSNLTLNLELADARFGRVTNEPFRSYRIMSDADQLVHQLDTMLSELLTNRRGDADIGTGAVRETIRRQAGQLKFCYVMALKKDPHLDGNIAISWTILADGRAVEVRVKSTTTANPEFEKCLLKKVDNWLFPAGVDREVEWPFVFQKAEDAAPMNREVDIGAR